MTHTQVEEESEDNTVEHPSDDYFQRGQNEVISQTNTQDDTKPTDNEKINEINTPYFENRTQRLYSDFLIDGIPIWEKENRGMTEEEGEAYKAEVKRLNKANEDSSSGNSNETKSRAADMAEANLSGDGVLFGQQEDKPK